MYAIRVGQKCKTRKQIKEYISDKYEFSLSDIWTDVKRVSFDDVIIIDEDTYDIVGFINYDINECSEITINHLEINPSLRGLGYAKKIINSLKIVANAIYVTIDNNSPIEFYKKVGFRTIIQTRNYQYMKMELNK